MENDLRLFGQNVVIRDKRLEYERQKPRVPTVADGRSHVDSSHPDGGPTTGVGTHTAYISMEGELYGTHH